MAKIYDGNFASQAIAQEQDSEQNSQVVSGDDKEDSGNNLGFQNQENRGNNALLKVGVMEMATAQDKALVNLKAVNKIAK